MNSVLNLPAATPGGSACLNGLNQLPTPSTHCTAGESAVVLPKTYLRKRDP